MIHKLKLKESYFDDVKNGTKTFEIRKNDRGFACYDRLIFQEVSTDGKSPTGRECFARIVYVMTAEEFPAGLQDGYCVLGIERCGIGAYPWE